MKGLKESREIINGKQTMGCHRHIHEVTTRDGLHLIMTHKIPLGGRSVAPVMLVHGLGQNRYTWNLSKRSFENYLVSQGFETFNVELRGHGMSRANACDYPKRFRTYFTEDIPAFMDAVREISGHHKMFFIGHSLGATLGYCLDAECRDQLLGLISIGGPFNMGKGNLLLKTIARTGVLFEKILPFRPPYPKAFYIDYIGAIARSGLFIMDNRYYKLPLQVWYPGSMERNILEERIQLGFDRTGFNVVRFMFKWGSEGRLRSLSGDVDYEDNITKLKAPVLFVVGDKDVAVPLEAIQEAYEKAGSQDKQLKVFGLESTGTHFGHIDLILGKHAPVHVWPHVLRWMRKRLP